MNTPDANLNPEIVDLKQQVQAGTMSKDRFLDELVMHNAGYSNDWGLNLLGSMLADPLLLGGEVAAVAGKAAIAGRMAKASEVVKMLKPEEFNALSKGIQDIAANEGKVLSGITNEQILGEAERLGIHGDAINAARKQMTAYQSFGDSIAHMEPIFNAAQNVADPFRMIGRRGSQPVLNAWKTAQATMGVAYAYNIKNFRLAQSVFGEAGLARSTTPWATSDPRRWRVELVVSRDLMAVRRVVDARPSTVAEALRRVEELPPDRGVRVTA